jgi:hypothetical protein
MSKSIYLGLLFSAFVLAGAIPTVTIAQQTDDGIKQDTKDSSAKLVVTAKQFEIGMSRLNGKSIGPPRQMNGIFCHQLTREDYYIVTGIDAGKNGGLYCHFH